MIVTKQEEGRMSTESSQGDASAFSLLYLPLWASGLAGRHGWGRRLCHTYGVMLSTHMVFPNRMMEVEVEIEVAAAAAAAKSLQSCPTLCLP